MRRLIKWLFALLLLAGALFAASYAGARAAAGKIVGPNDALSGRSVRFAWNGAAGVRGRPRAWVFTYASSRVPGLKSARIVVSPTGSVLLMSPPDLDIRIERWQRSRLP